MRHESSKPIMLPLAGVDPVIDRHIQNGQIRDVVLVTQKNGKQFRVGRTKGATYRKPVNAVKP